MTPIMIGIIGIVVLLVLLVSGMPIAATMAVVGIVFFGLISGFGKALSLISMDLFANINSYTLSVISMFTLMGFFALHAGIGTQLYNFVDKCLGHLPGGMAIASEGACALFGAVCGSGTATVSTIGSIALPEMKRYGYSDSLSTAAIAAGGGLGLLIPPSMTAIVYGLLTEQSIGKLFMAGIMAGVILMLFFMIAIYIMAKRKPDMAPTGVKSTWKQRWEAMGSGLLEVVIIFAVSIGGLSVGWFTPTEGGAIGAFAVLAVCLIRRKIAWKGILAALTDTAKTIGMVVFLIACATAFSRFLAVSRISSAIADGLAGLDLTPTALMIVVVLIYLVFGCFVDSLPLIMLTVPIFYPIVVDMAGYDPIWFGVIITIVAIMGTITPPVGINAYVVKSVARDVSLQTVFKGVWPFIGCQLASIALFIAAPELLLFIPNHMM
ncbi:MAG: TRAP transporter large permease [Clostridiales Family XIII bacterium]|jgi:tripartite ATP-independent transporter DctM subunit|nr:TRAP transporter large permease [Clostridiales Family XIII bacterium]